MPAVSTSQQSLMGIVHSIQKGEKVPNASPEAKKMAKTMKKKDVKDFASTKHKNLPDKVKEDLYDRDPQSHTYPNTPNNTRATGPDDSLYILKKLRKMAKKNPKQKIPIGTIARSSQRPPQSESLMFKYFPHLKEGSPNKKPGDLLKYVTADNNQVLKKMIKKVMSQYNVSPKIAVITIQKAADNLM